MQAKPLVYPSWMNQTCEGNHGAAAPYQQTCPSSASCFCGAFWLVPSPLTLTVLQRWGEMSNLPLQLCPRTDTGIFGPDWSCMADLAGKCHLEARMCFYLFLYDRLQAVAVFAPLASAQPYSLIISVWGQHCTCFTDKELKFSAVHHDSQQFFSYVTFYI